MNSTTEGFQKSEELKAEVLRLRAALEKAAAKLREFQVVIWDIRCNADEVSAKVDTAVEEVDAVLSRES